MNPANGLVIAAFSVPGNPFQGEYTSFRTAISAASIPAIWDGQSDGRWDELDATTGKPRWITESGLVPDIYPTSKAIIRSNTVTIPDSLEIASDGFIAIEEGAALIVDGSLDANAVEVNGGGTLVVDGPFTVDTLTLTDGTVEFHDTQSPVLVGSRLVLDGDSKLRFAFDGEKWHSPLTFEDPRRAQEFAGELILDFDALPRPSDLVGATLNLFDWNGRQPAGEFDQVIATDGFQPDLSRLYTSGEVVVVSVPEPHGMITIGLGMLCAVWFIRRFSKDCLLPSVRLSTALLSSITVSTACFAQFKTVINLPPDTAPTAIGSNSQLNVLDGGTLPSSPESPFQAGLADGSSSNVEINVLGGAVGDYAEANAGSVVNMSAGRLGRSFKANSGSDVNISGGTVGFGFNAFSGSEVSISGGTFSTFNAYPGSNVSLVGGEFLFNGAAPGIPTVSLGNADVLTGTLADGSVVFFSPLAGSDLNSVVLADVPLPPLDTTPIVVSSENVPSGLRPGQSLTLREGGALPSGFPAVNAKVSIEGGTAQGLDVVGSQVDISSGNLAWARVYFGSQVDISGGGFGSAIAYSNSEVNISGVASGNYVAAYSGSRVNLTGVDLRGAQVFEVHAESGGRVDVSAGRVDSATAYDGLLSISGGFIYEKLDAYGGTVNISGGFFWGSNWIGGNEESLTVANISGGVFAGNGHDTGVFRLFPNTELTITGGSIDAISTDDDPILGELGPGYRKLVIAGGAFGNLDFWRMPLTEFVIRGSDFRIDGEPINGLQDVGDEVLLSPRDVPEHQGVLTGVLADGTPFHIGAPATIGIPEGSVLENVTLQVASPTPDGPPLITASTDDVPWGIREGQTLVVDSCCSVRNNFVAGRGSTVHVEVVGHVGHNLEAVGADVRISGGTVGREFGAYEGSRVDISGGVIGDHFEAVDSEIIISDGLVDGDLTLWSGKLHVSGGAIGTITAEFGTSEVLVAGGSVETIEIWQSQEHEKKVAIAGGSVGRLYADGEEVHIYASQVSLDGSELLASLGNDLPNGRVDQDELDAVLLNRGTSVEPLAAESVPEPVTVGLLLLALAGVKVILQRGNQTRRTELTG